MLKLLSEKSGLNFVAGRNITGRVTIFAKEANLWDVFERIMIAHDLAYERQGTLINVMTAQDYAQLYGDPFQWRKDSRVISPRFVKAGQLATVKTERVVFLTPQVISASGEQVLTFPVGPSIEQLGEDVPMHEELVPATYQVTLREILDHQLARRLGALSLPEGSLIVSFTLSHDGRLIGRPEVTSLQGDQFVEAATAAVEAAAPFPPFPEGSRANEIHFRVAVDYHPKS